MSHYVFSPSVASLIAVASKVRERTILRTAGEGVRSHALCRSWLRLGRIPPCQEKGGRGQNGQRVSGGGTTLYTVAAFIHEEAVVLLRACNLLVPLAQPASSPGGLRWMLLPCAEAQLRGGSKVTYSRLVGRSPTEV